MLQYNKFAYIYDELMNCDVDYDKWCDFIENQFIMHGVDPDSICELACGTGNITSRMEKRGYNMTGVDISCDMISVAKKKLKRADMIVCDMSSFVPEKKYDAFLCMIDGINYVVYQDSLQKTFTNVKNSLSDGGVFIFDISTRYKLKNVIGNETFIHSDYDVFYSWQNRYIEKYNLSDMLLNFFVRNRQGFYERFEERHLQRGHSEKEIRYMLKKAGFQNIDVYDELTFDLPYVDSQRIVFVCC